MSSKSGVLYVRIVSCHDIRKADILTQNDTYVVTSFRGKTWKTSIVPNTAFPSWKNEIQFFSFVIEEDAKHDVLEFTIKEKDLLLRDETLHHITFPLSNLESNKLNHIRLDKITFEVCLGNFVFLPQDKVNSSPSIKLFTDCDLSQIILC